MGKNSACLPVGARKPSKHLKRLPSSVFSHHSLPAVTFSSNMGDQYYVDEYDEEPDMDELKDYMSPDEGDGDLAGFERPELNVDLSTAVVVSNLPQVRFHVCISPCTRSSSYAAATNRCMSLVSCAGCMACY